MPDIGDLAKAIQLALAPVFLLTGIGALINVMTGRLARIVDRGRAFAEGQVSCVSCDHAAITLELETLEPAADTLPASRSLPPRSRRYSVCAVIGRSLRRGDAARAIQVLIGAFFAVQRKIERLDCARAGQGSC